MSLVRFKIKRRKKDAQKRAERILAEPRKTLTIGVMLPESADRPSHYNGASIGEVAFWSEFGTMDVPARSWLRDWYITNRKRILEQLGGDTFRVLYGGENEGQALAKRGGQYVKQIKGRINRRIPPPNRPNTLLRKTGDVPLIDEGDFKRAIKYTVSTER